MLATDWWTKEYSEEFIPFDSLTQELLMDIKMYVWAPLGSHIKLSWPNHAQLKICSVFKNEMYIYEPYSPSFIVQ